MPAKAPHRAWESTTQTHQPIRTNQQTNQEANYPSKLACKQASDPPTDQRIPLAIIKPPIDSSVDWLIDRLVYQVVQEWVGCLVVFFSRVIARFLLTTSSKTNVVRRQSDTASGK